MTHHLPQAVGDFLELLGKRRRSCDQEVPALCCSIPLPLVQAAPVESLGKLLARGFGCIPIPFLFLLVIEL